MPQRRSGTVSLLVALGLLTAISTMAITGEPGRLGQALHEEFGRWWPLFVSVQFLVFTPAIFLAEHRWPARPEQRGIGPSVVFDAFYFAFHLPTIVAIAALVSGPIVGFLQDNASWMVLDATDAWPTWVAVPVGAAMADLGGWFAHLLKHKVPVFWRFHMIHHAQPRMSMFTANRTHPIDSMVDVFVLLVPFFVLFPSFTAQAANVAALTMARGWLERLQHANVRTNLGPVRWLFVTPQSHRVHHSTEERHWSSNYATFLAWDRLFGTQHPDVTSYPTTGFDDPLFPEPRGWSPKEFAASFVGQMLFPFDTSSVDRATAGGGGTGPSRSTR